MEYEKAIFKIYAQELIYNWKIPFNPVLLSRQAIGTGFFIDNNGTALTCAHILEKSAKIYIEIWTGEKYDGEIIGFNPSDELDIGLIRIPKYKSQHYIKLGNSFKLKRGMSVVVVGFPLGQSYIKYTKGIISGFQDGIIQTDTAINGGNSGGPMIHDNKVVGIVISKIMQAENVGYAVPIAQYLAIKKDLMKGGIVRKPNIGIEYNETTSNLLAHFSAKNINGVYITHIFPEAPIRKTGMREGVILTSIDGYKIDNYGVIKMENLEIDLEDYVAFIEKGKKIILEWRYGEKRYKREFKYDTYTLPIHMVYPVYENIIYRMLEGFILMNMTMNHVNMYPMKLNKYIKITERIEPKIIIDTILPASIASKTEIMEDGDIITHINDMEVKEIKDIDKALKRGDKDRYIIMKNERGNIYAIDKKTMMANTQNILKSYGIGK